MGGLTILKRYNLVARAVTTKCTKTVEEVRPLMQAYFDDLNNIIETQKPPAIYNMDEVPVFFELPRDTTLEIKGKKVIGRFSCGKEKERVSLVVTASSEGHLLPPFLIFKTTKPKNKTFKDYPADESLESLKCKEINEAIGRIGLTGVKSYSGWNCTRIMQRYWNPYFIKNVPPNSLLMLDNHASHVSDGTVESFHDRGINYIHLTPNTTCIAQPVDLGIGGTIKGKIKRYYEDWVIENWESNEKEFIKYNKKKNKYTFKAPDRNLITRWIIRAYEETERRTIIECKDSCRFTLFNTF